MRYLLVGGPWAGESIEVADDVTTIVRPDELGMAYHKTVPTDLALGTMLFGTDVHAKVFEWHERDWDSPAVATIKQMVRDAAAGRIEGK